MGFSSFVIENQNPNKATVIVAGFKGPVPIQYGESHTFPVGSGYDVASEGRVLFDVSLFTPEGPLEVKPRDNFNPEKFKVFVTVQTEKTD
ncbi:hypothetical protein CDD81_561 [Ophiocordyceps australis]|uniref:Uncharacterized protein n=1 Tax=Ophiocordyceps australis TaxID=1399860 RepID=A0A2C5YEA6_9HYPO|nr:hypothetical protein CDD81_561 [Ophiocordyceps australis]